MFRLMLWTVNSSMNRNILWKLCLETNSQSQINFQACFRHTVAHAGTVRPVRVTSVGNGKGKGRWKDDGMVKQDQYPRRKMRQLPDEIDEDDSLDGLADTISKYSSKRNAATAEAEHTRKMIGKLKFHRYKTIENKFFRKPTPPNLLTWAAKEQIRYLHRLDPEEWSVQELSNMFPVSEEIIINVIKSKASMFREESMLHHDEFVQKAWENLMTSLENVDSAISGDVVQAFKNSLDEIVIQNATGIPDLPFPVRNTDKFNPRGDFSAIVKDCYDAKEKLLKEAREKLQSKSQEISAILSKIAEKFEMKSEQKTARFMKLTNRKKPHISNPATPYTEQLAVRTTNKLGPVSQEKNVQENMGTLMAQKYKDSLFSSHAEESGNKKRDILRKVHVKREAQQKNNSHTYVAGDCIYDKSGVFLYRIP